MPNPFDSLFGGGNSNPTPGYPRGRFASVPGESIFGVGSETARARQSALDADRIRAEGYARGDEERQAQAEALQSLAAKRMQNPNLPGQQLMAQWLVDPEGGMKLMKRRGLNQEFIGKAVQALTVPDQAMAEGQTIVRQQPDGSYMETYSNPKPKSASQIIMGGSPEAEAFGLSGQLKPGERAEVQYTMEKDGSRRITGFQFPDRAGITINNQPETWQNKFEMENAQRTANRRSQIEAEQRNMIEAGNLTHQILQDIEQPVEGAKKMGVVGWIARKGEGMAQQARAVVDQFPQLKQLYGDPAAFDETIAKFPVLAKAAESSVFRSNMLNLTFVLASALLKQEGRDLTEKDVQKAMEMLGEGSGSPTQMRASLLSLIRNKVKSMDLGLQVDQPNFERYSRTGPPPSTESYFINNGWGYMLEDKPGKDTTLGKREAVTPEAIGQMDVKQLNTLDWDNLSPEQLSAATARMQQIRSAVGGQR